MSLSKLPDVSNPLSAPFWEGTRAGELRVQRCDSCGYLRWPPSPVCPQCGSEASNWIATQGRGRLYSYATYHRAFDPSLEDDLPYTVGLIELVEGPRIYGRLAGDVSTTAIGDEVEASLVELEPGITFVEWKLLRPKSPLETEH